MSNPIYQQVIHTAPEARSNLFCNVAFHAISSPKVPLQILDIGCGVGDHSLNLARKLPLAHVLGVDISEHNIHAAERNALEKGLSERVAFYCGDYLVSPTPQQNYDLIISDTTLHLIGANNASLFGKICDDLGKNSFLVISLPYVCAYNHLLWFARRILRAIRGNWTDSLILFVAKIIFGHKYSEAVLRERLIYMYILPERYDSPKFRNMLHSDHGLTVISEVEEPFILGKANHRILVLSNKGSD